MAYTDALTGLLNRTAFAWALMRYNTSHEHSLSIALGCDRFCFSEGDTIAKPLSRADARMYEDKRKWKEYNGYELR